MAEASEDDPDFERAWQSLSQFRRKNAEWIGLAYP
jgi:hypothetical protein